jgi:Tol biopolymer transport system component
MTQFRREMTTVTLAFALAGAGLLAGQRTADVALRAAVETETVRGDVKAAIEQYKHVVETYGKTDRAIAAQALLRMAEAYQKLGDSQARSVYERVVRDYADQREAVTLARGHLGGSTSIPKSGVMTRQVWSGPEADIQGSISANGRFLSFSDRRTGDLAIRDLISATDRRLTANVPNALEYAQESVFSPDASQIAYAWFNKDFRYELRVLNAQSTIPGSARVLYSNPEVGWIGPSDWSSDGKWIAVQIRRNDRTAQIGLVSPVDGSLRVLKSVDWRGSTKMFFSPDGRYLAFDLPSSETSDQRDVFALATDGSRQVSVAIEPSNDAVIGWSPDGKQLLFTSDRGVSTSLWAASFEPGTIQQAPRLIKSEIGTPFSLGITRSGNLYYGIETGGNDLIIAPIDSAPVTTSAHKTAQALRVAGDNRLPDWSPDGKLLAYNSFRRVAGGFFNVLMIRSVETGETRELRPPLVRFSALRWAPDGRTFIVQGTDTKGRQGLFRLDAQTGGAEFVTQGGSTPQWSPDGKKLYFRRNAQREQMLLERDMASGEERELLRGESRWQTISPDGRYAVGFDSDRTAVLVVSLPGGTARELLKLKTPERLMAGMALTPDGKSVVFTKTLGASSSETELWLAPLDGGQARRIDLGVRGLNPAIRSDGRMVAIQIPNPQRSEVWMMENFLPALSTKK